MKPKPLDSEKLAELEHKQWVEWSKEIARTENISEERCRRWKKLWIEYKFLTEKEKEQDREYARKVIGYIKSACEFYLRYKDKPELLDKEQHKLWVEISNKNRITLGELKKQYNKWLFKLAFKDVLEELRC